LDRLNIVNDGRARRFLGVAVLGASLTLAACHEEGDIRVRSLDIEGNQALDTAEIQAVMETEAAGPLPWSRTEPFDRETFSQDLRRVQELYASRGYPSARISELEATLNEAGDTIRLRVGIAEGDPVRVESMELRGFDVLPADVQAQIRATTIEPGQPRDRQKVAESERAAREMLLNNGFAHATVETTERPGVEPGTLVVLIEATPGPATVFGDITVVGNAGVSESVILRRLTFAPGDRFQQSDVVRSERRLGSIEVLSFADIDASSGDRETQRIPVTVTVAEDPPRRLELRAGYGTEDRVRGSIEWSHANFMGDLRRVTAAARWSSIDRGVRLGFTQPYLGRSGFAVEASASSWWTSETVYTSDVTGGRIGLSYRLGEDATRQGARSPADVVRVSYLVERVRSTVRPDVLSDLTNVATLIALGLDPVDGQSRGTKAAIAVQYERTSVNNLANPTRGYGLGASWEETRPALGGTFDYRKLSVEGRGYLPAGSTVLAARLRTATIVADSDADVPFSERYFLGGSSTLRGWGRYQVSPSLEGIPIGGRTVLDSSLEWRMPLRGALGGVVFVDAGNVWSGSLAARASGLRADTGVGLRYSTPIGIVRADIGYQLTPIDDLIVDGEREDRPWRLHLSIGQAF
jgi:outer membrane protein assembly complex protein YaeT